MFEAVKTNVAGAQNVIDCAIDRGVKKVVALSTDKACAPINLYGATKLCSDKLFIQGNAYSGPNGTKFSVVRYGNVAGSRGSVIPFFQDLVASGAQELPITDLAKAVAPELKTVEVGIRPGEKIHECMITKEDARNTVEKEGYYIILPDIERKDIRKYYTDAKKVAEDFEYTSGNNNWWLTVEEMKQLISEL